jgi:hypothetical protein
METNPAFDGLRARHMSAISEQAARITQHIGYVNDRIKAGRPETVGLYAQDLEASCARMLAAVNALGTIEDVEKALEKEGKLWLQGILRSRSSGT